MGRSYCRSSTVPSVSSYHRRTEVVVSTCRSRPLDWVIQDSVLIPLACTASSSSLRSVMEEWRLVISSMVWGSEVEKSR